MIPFNQPSNQSYYKSYEFNNPETENSSPTRNTEAHNNKFMISTRGLNMQRDI